MRIDFSGKARIRHCETGNIYEIERDELNWEAVDSHERGMGQEVHYEAVVEHSELGLITWGLWEYPTGIENDRETNAGAHEVVEDFNYGLRHEEPVPHEWIDYSVPDDPFSIFMNSYHHTGDLLADHGTDNGGSLLNRMIFSQQITALEAYLGDTLLNEVMNDPAAKQRLIEHDTELVKAKFSLAEISNEINFVELKVRERLRSILYHNLAKVDVLYKISLGIRILDGANDRDGLFNAVKLRHDCVHRNGFDKDGIELQVFTKEFVQDAADLIREFVESTEKAICTRSREAF